MTAQDDTQFLHAVLPEPSTQYCHSETSYYPTEQDAVRFTDILPFPSTYLNLQVYLKQVRDTLHIFIFTHLQKTVEHK